MLRQQFPELLPRRIFAANDIEQGLRFCPRDEALAYRHISLDPRNVTRWLTFDIDRPDGYFAAHDANLPAPNFRAVNPANGHAHVSYALLTPVSNAAASRQKPLDFLAAVQRGYTKRLGADPRYVGLIAKNPTHPHWRSDWPAPEPYTLPQLADWLFPADTAWDRRPETAIGVGRNVTIFDELRRFAYREVRRFKVTGDFNGYSARLMQVGSGLNLQFPVPLRFSELRAIVRSVANWTWRRFSIDGFIASQTRLSARGHAKRWGGHVRPWLSEGVSRATWYRRKGQVSECISDMGIVSPVVPRVPLTVSQPWVAEGISRRTWYRRRARKNTGNPINPPASDR